LAKTDLRCRAQGELLGGHPRHPSLRARSSRWQEVESAARTLLSAPRAG
jgi:hypothetical protein